jgi:hypothetical protein
LRSDESLEARAAYILQNPSRAGLLAEGSPWPFVWQPDQAGNAVTKVGTALLRAAP